MLEVRFYDKVLDEKLRFAVILSKTQGKWVFCRHRERQTLETPGGHREAGEDILDTAKRELYEETGAIKFEIQPICAYSVMEMNSEEDLSSSALTEKPFLENRVSTGAEESFGMLYYAEIEEFEAELHSEIEETIITEELPKDWTYPLIQPKLMEYARNKGFI